jgi:hypothetical protein
VLSPAVQNVQPPPRQTRLLNILNKLNRGTNEPQSRARSSNLRLRHGAKTEKIARRSSSTTARFHALGPRGLPGSIPTGRPQMYPPRRWQRFVTDVGPFLDSAFCAVAAALGWGPLDLFGCDCDRPFARIDQAGLLWSLNGDRLLAISEDIAVLETGTGARQVFRRKPNGAGRVLAWELRP